MAGSATAERGARQQESSGPPLVRWLGPRRLRTIIILALAVVLLVAGTGWVLYGSQWLRVERVSVSGTKVLTPPQVREAAAVPVGSPLLSVDIDAIEARLRTELPRIHSVDVVRSWPHGIGLKVTERTPVLLVQKGSNFVEVDDEGVRFATVSEAPKGVPMLEMAVSSSRSAAASLRRFGEARLVREAVKAAGSLPMRRRAGHPGRQGPFLRRHLAGVERRPHGRVGKCREGRGEGPYTHRSHESRPGRAALRCQRSHRPCVSGELTHVCAGQHPGWAVTRLIT